MKSEAELEKCYGVGCIVCAADDCELRECGINRIREKQNDTALAFARKDELPDDTFTDNLNNFGGDYMQQFIVEVDHPEPSIAELLRQTKLETLRHVAHYWAEFPNSFDALMSKIMFNENQTILAKKKGVTRQCISKAIRQETNDKFKKQIARLEQLNTVISGFSQIERDIYRLCFEDRVSIRSAAIELNISPAKVFRMKQHLREKLQKSETVNTGKNKKRQKNK